MGKTFIDRLDEPILSIGKDVFSRRQMIDELHCANFAAAARLSQAVEGFAPKSINDLARRLSLDNLLGVDGVGVMTVFVWLTVLDHAGKDPEGWLNTDVNVPTAYANSKPERRRRPRRQ